MDKFEAWTMSVWQAIEHFFSVLFTGPKPLVSTVVNDLEPIVIQALPIVQRLAGLVSNIAANDKTGKFNAVSGYLAATVKDGAVLAPWLAANANIPVNNMLHNAGVLVLSQSSGNTNVAEHILVDAVGQAVTAFKAQGSLLPQAMKQPPAEPLVPMPSPGNGVISQ